MLGLKKVFSFGKKNNKETPTKDDVKEERSLSPFEEEMLRQAAAKKAQEQTEDVPSEAEHLETPHPISKDDSVADIKEEKTDTSQTISTDEKPTSKTKEKSNKKENKVAQQAAPATKPIIEAPIEDKIEKPKTTEIAPEKAPQKKAQKVTVQEQVEEKQDSVEVVEVVEEYVEPKKLWIQRLRMGLLRSSKQLGESIGNIFTKRKLDEDTLQDLEDVLIQADLGVETAMRITDALASGRYGKDIAPDEVRQIMGTEINKVLEPVAKPLELDLSHKPHVILVVGVNGTGKTTTIGKLAAKLTAGGLKVMLAAGDTFRAAAIEQLHIWGKRTNSHVVSTKLGADAASLAYEAYEKAKEEGADVLIIDTAGRLQNKTELMDELAKIVRVLGKHDPDAPHTVLQTLDATTGQNALNQVEIFRNIAGVNGLVMTKLDGTARGGILVAIAAKHKLPVYFIGVGEGIDDLEPFKASDFAEAIAGFH